MHQSLGRLALESPTMSCESENGRSNQIVPFLAVLAPGITLAPAVWGFSPVTGKQITAAWLINLVVFIPSWLVLTAFPRWRSPSIILMFSGFRLTCLPVVLFFVKKQSEEIDPTLLGWTLGLYVLNLISITVMESRIRS